MLANCIADDSIECAKVREALASVSLSDGCDAEAVYLTLLALFILDEAFTDQEDEWQLIASKARKWLTGVGVPKPATLVRKFKFKMTK